MFDIKGINKRYFGITLYLEEDGEEKKVSINVEPPKVKTLKKLTSLANSSEDKAIDELEEAIIELLNKNKERIKVNEYVEELTIDEMTELLTAFFKWLNEEKKAKKLKIPFYPKGSNKDEYVEKNDYIVNTLDEKLVRDYTGYNFREIDDLEVFEFWLLLRDSYIYKLKQSEEGMKYLDKCWILEQTKPDRKALREHFGKASN